LLPLALLPDCATVTHTASPITIALPERSTVECAASRVTLALPPDRSSVERRELY